MPSVPPDSPKPKEPAPSQIDAGSSPDSADLPKNDQGEPFGVEGTNKTLPVPDIGLDFESPDTQEAGKHVSKTPFLR